MTIFILGRGPISLVLAKEMSQLQRTVLVSSDMTPISTLNIFSYSDFCKLNFTKDDIFFICWRGMPKKPSQIYRALDHLIQSSTFRNTIYNLSTVAVYGQAFKVVSEETLAVPINEYGKTKLDLEMFLNDSLECRLVNLRLSNIFGSAGFDDVINRMIRCAFGFESIDLYEPDLIRRDFFYLEDTVQVIRELSQKSREMSRREIFNIASGQSIFLDSLVELVIRELKRDVNFTIRPIPSDVIQVSQINNQKLFRFINKKGRDPRDSLQQYLQSYL